MISDGRTRLKNVLWKKPFILFIGSISRTLVTRAVDFQVLAHVVQNGKALFKIHFYKLVTMKYLYE
jgi:hypothetical protein